MMFHSKKDKKEHESAPSAIRCHVCKSLILFPTGDFNTCTLCLENAFIYQRKQINELSERIEIGLAQINQLVEYAERVMSKEEYRNFMEHLQTNPFNISEEEVC